MVQASSPTGGQHADGGVWADGLPKRFGKYTLLRRLATGGMAELFLALHRAVAGFEKLIVIKRILPSMNADKAFIDMLLHEARVAATLSHPNVVEVYDVGFAEGAYYIAMEHIHGEDLRSIVRQMKRMRMTEFPMEHALTICIGVCAGLAYAHDKRSLDGQPLRIVHRDISPQNVVVAYTGDVKVVDFGIAKSGTQTGEDTKSGRLKGKVPYMSPEQARGENIDWRSDIFSAGIMLFELTTGKRLFKGANELETLRLICERDYPYPSEIRPGYPPKLETIVMRALAKDRAQRYQSAREMQADLEAFVRDERAKASELEVGAWMQVLFAQRIDRQKAVLQDLKQLADVIAAESLSEAGGVEGLESTTSQPAYSMMPSAPGSAHTLAGSPAPRSRSAALWLALGIAMIAVASGSYLVVRNVNASTFAATSASSLATMEAAVPVADNPSVAYGALTLVTQPEQASIWIDGALRAEKTPASIDRLPRGTPITVRLTMEGYAPERREVTLTDAEPEQRIEVTLAPGTVTLVVKTNAPGAKLFVDGKEQEGLRIDGLSADAEHQLALSADGYRGRTTTFRAGPSETKTMSLMLQKEPDEAIKGGGSKASAPPAKEAASVPVAGSGKLNVGSRGGFCNVSVGGRSYGSTPVGGIVLPAGSHAVVCKPADGPAKSMSVTIQPEQTARVSFRLGG